MSKYIIITMSITNVGGAEQYIYNKVEYLSKQGFQVFVFSALQRPILIEKFKQYRTLIYPELMYSPSLFFKSHVIRVIDKMISVIGNSGEEKVYVETHNVHPGLWGELLAQRLSAKHIVFNLQETHSYSNAERQFLEYKLQQKALTGITEKSVSMMMGREIQQEPWMRFSAYCNNVVNDCIDLYSDKITDDVYLTIGSIGRLEKGFVFPMIDCLVKFFEENKDKKFNLIFIGGTNKTGIVEKIHDRLDQIPNLNLIITGFLYPIPRTLINNIDLFISTAGSAFVSYQEKRTTIKVHPENALPVQIMGYTYSNYKSVSMYDVLPDTSLIEQIKIAISNIDIKYLDASYSYNEVMENEFDRQLAFYDFINEGFYNDVLRVKPEKSCKNAYYYFLGHVFGGSTMQRILEENRKLFRI